MLAFANAVSSVITASASRDAALAAFARQGEAARDVRHVLDAQRLRGRVGLGVVVAVRQVQAALARVHDEAVAVLGILVPEPREHRAHAVGVEPRHLAPEVAHRRHAVDRGEQRLHRLEPRGLGRGRVHAARPVVAELRLVAPRLRLRRGRLGDDPEQHLLVAVGDLRERAVTRVRGRHHELRAPATVRVLVEVLARRAGGVLVTLVEVFRGLGGGSREHGEDQRGDESGCAGHAISFPLGVGDTEPWSRFTFRATADRVKHVITNDHEAADEGRRRRVDRRPDETQESLARSRASAGAYAP
jgi:hypothetical protein